MAVMKAFLTEILLLVLSLLRFSLRIRRFFGLEEIKNGMYQYYEYEGLPLSGMAVPEVRLKAALEYTDWFNDDVFLLTYPKSGCHFVSGVVLSIYKEAGLADKGRVQAWVPHELAPALALKAKSGARGESLIDLRTAERPRIIGSRLTWSLLPKAVRDGNIKVIHCIRNPKDAMCSAFPFYRQMGVLAEEETWENFFRHCLKDQALFGGYFKFMHDWYPNRHQDQMLNVYYEDLIQDLSQGVKDIASFLNIKLSDEQIERVTKANSFASKKKEGGVNSKILYRKGALSSTYTFECRYETVTLLASFVLKESVVVGDLSSLYNKMNRQMSG